jgi:hypothetical protein
MFRPKKKGANSAGNPGARRVFPFLVVSCLSLQRSRKGVAHRVGDARTRLYRSDPAYRSPSFAAPQGTSPSTFQRPLHRSDSNGGVVKEITETLLVGVLASHLTVDSFFGIPHFILGLEAYDRTKREIALSEVERIRL